MFSNKLNIGERAGDAYKIYYALWRYSLTFLSSQVAEDEKKELLTQLGCIGDKYNLRTNPFIISYSNKIYQYSLSTAIIDKKEVDLFILYAIDAFADFLTIEKVIGLQLPMHRVYLPNLDQTLEYNQDSVRLILLPEGKWKITSRHLLVNRRASDSKVLREIPSILLSQICYNQIDFLSNDKSFINNTNNALEIIRNTDSTYFDRLNATLKHMVPLQRVGENIHSSFTVNWLPGVIFLSDSDDPIVLSEAIVHEFGHNELNMLDTINPLFESSKILYYSPWRKDPRPIHGLFHALYVFTEVYSYLKKLSLHSRLDQRRKIDQKLDITLLRLLIGIEQINSEELSNTGQELFLKIRDFTRNENLSRTKAQERLREHILTWETTNPNVGVNMSENLKHLLFN